MTEKILKVCDECDTLHGCEVQVNGMGIMYDDCDICWTVKGQECPRNVHTARIVNETCTSCREKLGRVSDVFSRHYDLPKVQEEI